jgi:hypothetical protein
MAAAASLGEQYLQAASIPGLDFLHGPQEGYFCRTAACLGKLSQQTVGIFRPYFLHGFLEA